MARSSEPKLFASDETSYRRGSIRRIKMVNFVTYASCEVEPGPHLNVVIGPNGSGKSTIVCAIALGLGGPPSLLGRAKEVGEFVRHGADSACVEIELAGGVDGSGRLLPNVVIRRDFKRDNTTTWRINGKSKSKKEVEDRIQSLHIQIDNLCQFMPQDRVSNFAELNAQQLLVETEKAVGGEQLHAQHMQLIELRERDKGLDRELAEQQRALDDLKKLQERDSREVQRLRERAKAREHLERLQRKRPWLVFADKQAETKQLRQQFVAAVAQLKAAEESLAPLQALKSQLTADFHRLERSRETEQRSRVVALEKSYLSTVKQLQQAEDDYGQLLDEVAAVETQMQQRDRQVAQQRALIAAEEDKLAGLPSLHDTKEQVHDIDRQLAELRQRQAHVEQLKDNVLREISVDIEQPLRQLQQQLAGLQNEKDRRLNMLAQHSPNVYTAYKWIQENAGRFRAKVYGPLVLELSIADQQHAQFLEHYTPNWLKTAFVPQNEEDRDTLYKELHERQRLQIDITLPRQIDDDSSSSSSSSQQAPVSRYAGWGVGTYLDQVFQAPAPVRQALIEGTPIRDVLVGSDHTYQRAGDFLRQFPEVDYLVTPSSAFSKVRSRYDAGAVSLRTDSIRRAQWFSTAAADDRMQQLRGEIEQLQAQKHQRLMQTSELDRERDDVAAAQREQQRQKEALQKNLTAVNRVKTRISTLRADLEALLAHSLDEQLAAAARKAADDNRARLRCLPRIVDTLEQLVAATRAYETVGLQLIELRCRVHEVSAAEKRAKELLAPARRRFEAIQQTFEQAKAVLRALKTKAEQAAPLTPALQAEFETLPDTLSELDKEIRLYQARAEQTRAAANDRLLETFEQRAADIVQREARCAQDRRAASRAQSEMKELEAAWRQQLEQLVERISASFAGYMAEINCQGEVKLATDPDYDKWGLLLRVSFRADTHLRDLSAHFHSGGERSVSTMLFLISLQNITQCPFRLVDEINQGMDPINERMIFEQIVRAATEKHLPQYFLITPKLLPDLRFNERMCVLCIFNGPHQLHMRDWLDGTLSTISSE